MNDKDTRTSAYQTKPQAVEVDVVMFGYAFVAGIKHVALTGYLNPDQLALGNIFLEDGIEAAIEAYKKTKQEGNDDDESNIS